MSVLHTLVGKVSFVVINEPVRKFCTPPPGITYMTTAQPISLPQNDQFETLASAWRYQKPCGQASPSVDWEGRSVFPPIFSPSEVEAKVLRRCPRQKNPGQGNAFAPQYPYHSTSAFPSLTRGI